MPMKGRKALPPGPRRIAVGGSAVRLEFPSHQFRNLVLPTCVCLFTEHNIHIWQQNSGIFPASISPSESPLPPRRGRTPRFSPASRPFRPIRGVLRRFLGRWPMRRFQLRGWRTAWHSAGSAPCRRGGNDPPLGAPPATVQTLPAPAHAMHFKYVAAAAASGFVKSVYSGRLVTGARPPAAPAYS